MWNKRGIRKYVTLILTTVMVMENSMAAMGTNISTEGERRATSIEKELRNRSAFNATLSNTIFEDAIPLDATPSDATPSDATSSDADKKLEKIMPRDLSVGDLWEEWDGDMDFMGYGTEDEPYQIDSLSQLMGFSEVVASGTTFEGAYLELTCDIDLGSIEVNQGNWNPIGWYQNYTELGVEVRNPFKGHFDGGGYCISGLKITNTKLPLQCVGLFGVIDGGSVKNLTVEASDILGEDRVAVLSGVIRGSAKICDVTVTGYVASKGSAGGIAGEIAGGTNYVTVENCLADGIVLNSENNTSFVGGIAGNVQKADLIDNTVITYDGDANRIRGKGYVGGIAGRMNLTNIYNSYVSGTIGGPGAVAVGGIVGKYESGNLILARFAGEISKTNQGSASREGAFIGTREGRHNFTYGTEKNSNLAYLFTSSAAMVKRVFGSNIDGDNTFTKQAHIGYWTNYEKKFVTVAGNTETDSGDRYFYEEMEDGIRYIITQKLGKEFTSEGYYKGIAYRLDHFAPGYQGEPVRGYLVSVPRIDTKNANGTYDTDVAVLTAIAVTNNSWYRQIDKDHPSAIAPGETVRVATAPKNKDGNRYQMIYDELEIGKVKPPVYLDEFGERVPMAYASGGTYTFEMPPYDTEINVDYIKTTTKLTVNPDETTINIIQIRTGDRKDPFITTEVKNEEGVLIARYINGVKDKTVEVQPITIHAEHNYTGSSADKTVKWSVDDMNLIINSSDAGYTLTDARVMPNMQSAFIQNIITKEVQAQANSGFKNKINNTIYTKSAVVTAATNPATSIDNRVVYGNTKLNITFQIIDYTTIRVEGLLLNKNAISYTITRNLSGNRRNPVETITCSAPVILTATLNPNQPFYKNVTWADSESGKIITLTPKGDHTQDCVVQPRFDEKGKDNPVWIQNVIHVDNSKRTADPYQKLSGSAVYTETITATSEDQTHGHVMANCKITITFETIDNTYAYGYGEGGSSSGGGGSGGGTLGGGKKAPSIPLGSVVGNWEQTLDGKWIFISGEHTYNNEWAYIYNPYASINQSKANWFRFSDEGHMLTGWYKDIKGAVYYLNPISDNTQGQMLTGWNWIDANGDGMAECYYFSASGELLVNTTTPDGFTVHQDGAWIVDGILQSRANEI